MTKPLIISASMFTTMVLTAVNWFLDVFIPEWVGLSVPLFFIYFLLALLDTITGILNKVVKNGDEFKSYIFAKKLLAICVILISLGLTMHLEVYTKLEWIKPLFEVVRLFLYVGFIIWEFSSIRENSKELEWTSVVSVIDIILLPLNMFSDVLKSKLKSKEDEN